MTVGDRIKLARESLGLSQDDLARKMGYKTRQTISKAECYGDNITTTKIEKYAKALNVSIAYLMGWDVPEIEESSAEDDALFMRKYNLLTSANKQVLKSTLDALLESQEK